MSRMAAALLPTLWFNPAFAAEPLTADQAMENYRAAIPHADLAHCPAPGETEEIVVCGRVSGRDRNRLPLPIGPSPGDRVRGEPISAVAAAGTREKCSAVGPNQECGGGFPILGFAIFLGKIVQKKIVDPED